MAISSNYALDSSAVASNRHAGRDDGGREAIFAEVEDKTLWRPALPASHGLQPPLPYVLIRCPPFRAKEPLEPAVPGAQNP
ncbi:unnamed protein product [Boreogadus saida]